MKKTRGFVSLRPVNSKNRKDMKKTQCFLSSFSRFLLIVVLVPFMLVETVRAQDETPTAVTVQNRTGDLPFTTSIGTGVEHVDVSSGNLLVNIPLAHVKGRGIDFDFALRYDSRAIVNVVRMAVNMWIVQRSNYFPDPVSGFAWQTNLPQLTYTDTPLKCPFPQISRGFRMANYIVQDSHGVKHPLALQREYGDCNDAVYNANTLQGPDLDGEGIWATINPFGRNPSLVFPDGGVLNALGGVSDAFGNVLGSGGVERDSDGNSQLDGPGGTDTLGRTLVTQQNGTNQVLYKISDSNGVSQTYTVNYAAMTIATHFNVGGQELSQSRNVITSIVLPNGRSYSFQYDSYGGLTSLALPTGAIVTYQWATYANSTLSFRYVKSRTVSANGQNSTWTFSVSSINDPSRTLDELPFLDTVTDPQQNQATFESSGGKVTVARFYQGVATGNPLKQHVIDYVPFGSAIPGTPAQAYAYMPIRVSTTLDDGRVAKQEYDYETFTYPYTSCGSVSLCLQSGQVQTTQEQATRGNVTEIREFDYGSVPTTYGSGTPGPLIRRSDKTYLHNSNSNYLTRNIVNKVLQDTTYDGSGNQAAQTQYEYDNYVAGQNPLISTASTAPQHDYTNFSSGFIYRGNVTRVKRWLNTTNGFLTTTYQYDDLGNIRAITDLSDTRLHGSITTIGRTAHVRPPRAQMLRPTCFK